jgi:hypothetical protein
MELILIIVVLVLLFGGGGILGSPSGSLVRHQPLAQRSCKTHSKN